MLRKAFCGFDAHVAKSDYSLWGLRPPNPRGFFDRLIRHGNVLPRTVKRIIFEDGRSKYRLIDLEQNLELELTEAEAIDIVAARILKRYRPAFEELAK